MKTQTLQTTPYATWVPLVLAAVIGLFSIIEKARGNCYPITLEVTGANTNKTKCGFQGYVDSSIYYKQEVHSHRDSYIISTASECEGDYYSQSAHSLDSTYLYTAPDCSLDVTSYSESLSWAYSDPCTNISYMCSTSRSSPTSDYDDLSCADMYSSYGVYFYIPYDTTYTQTTMSTGSASTNYMDSGSYYTGTYSDTVTLSSVYETSELVGYADPSGLPFSSDWASTKPDSDGNQWGGTAYIDISPDESYVSRGKFKYRFKFMTDEDEDVEFDYYVVTVDSSLTYSAEKRHVKIPGTGDIVYYPSESGESMDAPDGSTPADNKLIFIAMGCPATCSCKSTATAANNSVDLRINLGATFQKASAGLVYIKEQLPTTNLGKPAVVKIFDTGANTVITNASGIRQVLSPQILVDIVTNSATKFQLKLYTNAGSFSGGLYSPSGSPYSTTTVELLGGDTNTVRISIEDNGITQTNDYVWSSSDKAWTLTTGGGLRVDAMTWNSATLTKTRLIKDGSSNVVFQDVRHYTNFTGVGSNILSKVTGTGAFAQTNRWSYYDNAGADGTNFGKVKMRIFPSGAWVRYLYDTNGLLTNMAESFQNAATNAADSLLRVTSYDYTTLTNIDVGLAANDGPRLVIVKLLGQEISRKYYVYANDETIEYECQTVGAGRGAADNLVTKTTYYNAEFHLGKVETVEHPDGTVDYFTYGTNSDGSITTNTVFSGNVGSTDGTKTVTAMGANGQMLSKTTTDIASGILLSLETYSIFDEYNRPQQVKYLDCTSNVTVYGCCGLFSEADREGTTTYFTYDALKRQNSSSKNSIIITNVFDANDNVVQSLRIGTDGSKVTNSSSVYDVGGQLVSRTDAMGNVTTFTNYFDGSGQTVKQITYPDGGTRIETYAQDGLLLSLTGAAVHGVRYIYGVASDGGVQRYYTKEIKLNDNGTDSSEWVTNFTDMNGRTYKTVYPDNSYSQSYFSNNGQLWKQRDPDGVVKLYQYNAKGEREYTAIDMDRNDAIGTNGTDRITRTIRDVISHYGTNVVRISSLVWTVNAATNYVTNSIVETSVEGLLTWRTSWGLTSTSGTAYAASGYRYVTNCAPDGSCTLSQYQYGRLLTRTRKDGAGTQIGQTTYGYDVHGRANSVSDARTGATTYTFNNVDRVSSVTAPLSQVTTNYFDNMNRVWKVGQPDGTYVTNEFLLTGEQQRTKGSQTYPVEYTYDYAGRMKTMKTWQNYAGNSGTATTTWNYDSSRGFLTSKRYDDNTGPTYTNTAAGRLKSRTWARNLTTTYNYDNGGSLTNLTYSDGTTPNVTYAMDRLGRPYQITDVGTRTLVYNSFNQLSNDTYSVSSLSLGSTIDFGYDSYQRRVGITNQSLGTVFTNGYDAASRLQTVSAGTSSANLSATYTYLANSSLATNIVFQSNGVTKLTTAKIYDNLNRLTKITSTPSGAGQSDVVSSYAYNSANQRTSVTNADNARWQYQYDALGQVISGKKYWSDGTVVAGEQFEYAFDDIGNRKAAALGGDQYGANLRYGSYSVNSLNEYTSRTVPSYLEAQGAATNTATVTVNNQSTYRKGEYFRKELAESTLSSAVWQGITNIAVLNDGANPDIVTTNTGNLFLPKTPESFAYDADGNLTNDGRWAYFWDAENRLTNMTANSSIPDGAKKKLDFSYDYQGRRIYKKVSNWNGSSYATAATNYFHWDGWNCIGEYTPGYTRIYLWGLDLSGSTTGAGGVGGLLLIQCGTTNCFPAYDGNGNVTALISATNGTILANYEYGPFSESLRCSGPAATLNPYRFSTRYTDEETDLLYYGYRYCNSDKGRWLSRDPIEDPGFTKTTSVARSREKYPSSLYGFVSNSAVNLVDVLGLRADPPRADLCADPCKWARDHYSELPGSTYGITVCCNGKKYGCVLQPGITATDPIARAIISDCVQVHENTHVADPLAKCRPKCGWKGPIWASFDNKNDQYQGECAAYTAELQCLEGKKPLCNGNQDCLADVQAAYLNALLRQGDYCR